MEHASGFIFDMDGCLLDTIWLWHEAERRITDDAGIVLTKEQRDELNALTLEEAGRFFHERFGIMDSGGDVVGAIISYMLDYYATGAKANPGVVEFVRDAALSGARLCVLSSSPQSFLQAGLACAGLKGFFSDEFIISAEDAGWTKRNPSTFEKVCDIMGLRCGDAWLFDDSWYALASAREAGLKTIGVFSSDSCGTHDELASHSDKVIDSFEELSIHDFA